MGDRCYLWMQVRKEDKKKIEEAFQDDCGWDNSELSDPNVSCFVWYDEESNYSSYDARLAAAAAGAVFHGHHGDGGAYRSQLFAAGGGVMYECLCDIDSDPVVRVTWSGQPAEQELLEVHRYLLKEAEAAAIFKGEDPVKARTDKAREIGIET